MVVAGCVGGACETGEVDEGGAADVVGYGFEGELKGMAEESVELLFSCKYWKEWFGGVREISCCLFVFGLLFREKACEGNDVSVNCFVLDWSAICCHDDGLLGRF